MIAYRIHIDPAPCLCAYIENTATGTRRHRIDGCRAGSELILPPVAMRELATTCRILNNIDILQSPGGKGESREAEPRP